MNTAYGTAAYRRIPESRESSSFAREQARRLEDLHEFLHAEFGQTDREAAELLLAAALPVSSVPYFHSRRPWFLIETDWPNRDCSQAWFAFGGAAGATRALVDIRLPRPDQARDLADQWIRDQADGRGGSIVDSEWRSMKNGLRLKGAGRGMLFQYDVLLARSVRLRVKHARGAAGLCTHPEARAQRLGALAGTVLRTFERGERIAQFDRPPELPKSFLYWCELLQRLNPTLTDWETLTGSLASLAPRLAALRGDTEVDGEHWRSVARVMSDSVLYLTRVMLDEAARDPLRGVSATRVAMKHGFTVHGTQEMGAHLIGQQVLYGRTTRRMRPGHADFRALANGEFELV